MSGGSLCDYQQYRISQIADEVEQIIKENKKERPKESLEPWEIDENGNVKEYAKYYYNFSNDTIKEFKKGLKYLKKAYIYAQRIDWLISDDDDENSFHKRLKEELKKEGF